MIGNSILVGYPGRLKNFLEAGMKSSSYSVTLAIFSPIDGTFLATESVNSIIFSWSLREK